MMQVGICSKKGITRNTDAAEGNDDVMNFFSGLQIREGERKDSNQVLGFKMIMHLQFNPISSKLQIPLHIEVRDLLRKVS